jgi:methylenetetrahydrofolate--tRNA-(uracil-5-)-methyltransferase
VFFAGQITGVEGYVESASSGIMAAIFLLRKLEGKEEIIPDNTTVTGALLKHIAVVNENFQPMNANFGILREGEKRIRDKKLKYAALAERALKNIELYKTKIEN